MPMVHDGRAEKGVRRAIVVVPGALASVGIYEPVLDWNVPDATVMAYRFPGIDGLELDHRLDISAAGELIAEVIRDLEPEEVYLVGFSTGGPVALEAARRIRGPEVSVALISSAGPFPEAVEASINGFFDVVKALFRSGRASPDAMWLENYRTLLYGRDHFSSKETAERSRKLAEMQRGHLRVPRNKMTFAHTGSLLTWTLAKSPQLRDMRIGLFHGAKDSVFSLRETRRFAGRIPADAMYVYPDQGHLLFITAPSLWEDIRIFFDLPKGR